MTSQPARRLGELSMMNCASLAHLKKYGTPRTLDDLHDHLVVHYSIRFGTDTPGFEYRDGNIYREQPMGSLVTVNSTDAYRAACLAGLGIGRSVFVIPPEGSRVSLLKARYRWLISFNAPP